MGPVFKIVSQSLIDGQQRAAGNRQAAGPIRNRRQRKSGDDGATVKAVHARTLTGKRLTVQAQRTVLACGGIENARLLEHAHRRAARERLVRYINSKISASIQIDTVMQTAVDELGRALTPSRCLIRTGADAANMPIAYEGAFDPVTEERIEEEAKARAESYLAFVRKCAQDQGIPCDTLCETSDHPYDAILKAADSRQCDLIVMTSHGRKGITAVLLGSETRKVLTHSKIPVLIVRSHYIRGQSVP